MFEIEKGRGKGTEDPKQAPCGQQRECNAGLETTNREIMT